MIKNISKPEVGMGVTEISYSDRYPFEVIEILNDKRIKVREMEAERTDTNGMSDCQEYNYKPNPDGEVKTLVLRNGKWRDLVKDYFNDENGKLIERETRRLGCSCWRIGKAEKYRDFSF